MATSGISLQTVGHESLVKRVLAKTDWMLVLATVVLTAFGMLMIYSATLGGGHASSYLAKQAMAMVIGMVVGTALGFLNYQLFERYWAFLFILGVMLLVFVLGFGTAFRSTRAWIHVGFMSFQPSEVVKIIFILALAGYLDRTILTGRPLQRAVVATGMTVVMIVLLLAQPDLSAAILYLPIMITLFYIGGVNRTYLTTIVSFILMTSILMLVRMYLSLSDPEAIGSWGRWMYGALSGRAVPLVVAISVWGIAISLCVWVLRNLRMLVNPAIILLAVGIVAVSMAVVGFGSGFIKPYQQKRLIAFVNPDFDPSDAGYQIIQTRIAIGSGGLLGKGLFQGTQTQLGFVPEKHTDFIFSLIAEEVGFLGALVTVVLYGIILARGVAIMQSAGETYGILVASGIVALFSFYLIVNVGMNLGVAPVIGLPFPFVSYGGSNLISSYAAVGLLNSIHLRKYLN